ncbi:alpha-2-macroglobulin family protein [Natronoflexus pectinivorans]|uniref:MG2 domain-containing protein n=1 Tax=Natronoflexus pectinivorans TaxID=682526 RepID=A0A4R2GDN0_9BACT|nr:alpha-2-macroglobulin family protein [Natronoflexus pectinivorans]TCO05419.1 MG2 domain-containing protein [Natronoflexus pectinivorans]
MYRLVLLLSLALYLSFSCRTSETMVHIDFSELWHHTDSLNKLNRPQATLEVVNEIVKQSRNQQSTEDYIKAIVLRFQLKQEVFDNALEETISELESEVPGLWMPAKQMVHSFLGDLYHRFYLENHWRLLQQPLAETDAEHLIEMSASEISQLSINHYLASLECREELISESSVNYQILLEGGADKIHLRPTLYDLLAGRLVEKLLSGELFEFPEIDTYRFSDDFLLQHRDLFVNGVIEEIHYDESDVKAIHILQDWLRFRINVGDVDALADIDLLRLELMYGKYEGTDGLQLFEKALKHLASESKDSEVYSSILYRHASLLHSQTHFGKLDSDRNYLLEALILARSAMEAWPDSEGARLSRQLEEGILNPTLRVNAESVVVPGSPVMFSVIYRNIDTLYTSLFLLDAHEFGPERYNMADRAMEQVVQNTPVFSRDYVLHDFGYYLERSAELKLSEGMEPGFYCLVVSCEPIEPKYLKDNKLFSVLPFQVSNLVYSEHVREEGLMISVVNRTNGQPVANATVSVQPERAYGRPHKEGEIFSTNQDGRLMIDDKGLFDRGLRLIINKGEDVLYSFEQSYFSSPRERRSATRSQFSFFTDRQIYRPGQFVHFKGVLLENRDGEVKAVANERVQVFMRDANGQEVASEYFVTNKYGSVSGRFLLPRSLLTGSFSIGSAHGHKFFSVEEYKRPRFEVTFKPHTEIALIGDTITVTAMAQALTGMPITSAEVNWTVTRYSYIGFRFPNRHMNQIASGTGFTDENGHVPVRFIALGEKDTNHNFRIELSVTDSNGETQTGSLSVMLGKHGVEPFVATSKPWYPVSELNDFVATFGVHNLSGEPVASEVLYKIERLRAPELILPERIWDEPDTILYEGAFFSFSSERKTKQSPDYVVTEGRKVVVGKEDTDIKLPAGLKSGKYRISMMVPDVSGDTLLTTTEFMVVDVNNKNYNSDEPLTLLNLTNRILQPGETVSFLAGTGLESARIRVLAAGEQGIILDREYDLDREWQHVSFNVPNDLTGHLLVQVIIFYHNRVYSKELNHHVITPDNRLEIDLIEYKEEMSPGEPATWMLRLVDGSGRPVQTELVALMYDASLDAYQPNSLNLHVPAIHRVVSKWRTRPVSLSPTTGKMMHHGYQRMVQKPYPRFFWETKIGASRDGFLMRATAAGSHLKEQYVVLNIVDDDVDLDIEEIAPMTRQEEVIIPTEDTSASLQIRRDLKETAFFFPHLETNSEGIAKFDFTMPESLTRWRFMALAHREDGVYATTEAFATTVLDLMVIPNLPRLVTEGDELVLKANIVNNSSETMQGTANMVVTNAISGEKIPLKSDSENGWHLAPGQTVPVSWRLGVPKGIKALEITVSAVSGELSDGEVHLIPVRPARTLITETKPVVLIGSGEHKIEMPLLMDATDQDFESFTFTYTQNAAWEILGVLPWLMERPKESSDQIFNRIFSAAVAGEILNQHPQIKRVLTAWGDELPGDSDALLSAMERNPELKPLFLEATPWLNQAQSDTERRRYFAALVRDGYLETELNESVQALKKQQLPNGAWPWFNGMMPSEQITATIVAGFGYLKMQNIDLGDEVINMIKRANRWLINELKERKGRGDEAEFPAAVLSQIYALSYFTDALEHQVVEYWINQLAENIPREPVSQMAYASVILNRAGHISESEQLLRSIEDRLIVGENETLFFRLPHGPYWHQAPIESHVVAMEALREANPENVLLEGMENWLISQKRTQSWQTTRATVAAVYALATSSRKLFDLSELDRIQMGGEELRPSEISSGSGFFSHTVKGAAINPAFGTVIIDKKSSNPSFASMHLSYFEQSGDVKAGGFLEVDISKYLRNLEEGVEQWDLIKEETSLKPGDRIMMRVVMETPQALDFVHVDAPRASNLEPVDLLSGFRYQSGLGYYMSIRDGGNSFFIDHLPRGHYTFTWEVTVSHSGEAVQAPIRVSCYYAPEFSGHSKGGTIRVEY